MWVTLRVTSGTPAKMPRRYPQTWGKYMLSDAAIRKAKLAEKSYKITDERGLHLLVRPTGAKLFQFRYRIGGREKTASLGQYPDVGLAEARERREELRKLTAKGIDPTTGTLTVPSV